MLSLFSRVFYLIGTTLAPLPGSPDHPTKMIPPAVYWSHSSTNLGSDMTWKPRQDSVACDFATFLSYSDSSLDGYAQSVVQHSMASHRCTNTVSSFFSGRQFGEERMVGLLVTYYLWESFHYGSYSPAESASSILSS